MTRARVLVPAISFASALAVIGWMAWVTAMSTRGPWFSAAVSGEVYSTTMVGATLLVAVLAAIASGQVANVARDARALDVRLALLRTAGAISTGYGIDIDRDIDETLNEILGRTNDLPPPPPPPMVTVEREGHESLVALATEGRDLRGEVVQREFARARSALHGAAARIWTAVAGPIAAGLVFLGIAGAMLPGSGGFAESNYVLNTALILFLGYGWAILLAWAVVGLAVVRATESPRIAK